MVQQQKIPQEKIRQSIRQMNSLFAFHKTRGTGCNLECRVLYRAEW